MPFFTAGSDPFKDPQGRPIARQMRRHRLACFSAVLRSLRWAVVVFCGGVIAWTAAAADLAIAAVAVSVLPALYCITTYSRAWLADHREERDVRRLLGSVVDEHPHVVADSERFSGR
jgi:hypothetical protein